MGHVSWRIYRYSNSPFHGLWGHFGWGPDTVKIRVNVWGFGVLRTAITSLQRGGFPTFATTLNSP